MNKRQFPIGEWARKRKEKRDVLVESNRCIMELNKECEELQEKMDNLKKKDIYLFAAHDFSECLTGQILSACICTKCCFCLAALYVIIHIKILNHFNLITLVGIS